MTDVDRPEFLRVMNRLAGIFQRTLDAELVEEYFLALKPFTLNVVIRACREAASECQFFPKPVELRGFTQEPEYYAPREVNGELTFLCPICQDRAVVLTSRLSTRGVHLGTFATPCTCAAGEAKRTAWVKANSKGQSFADSARHNTAHLRRNGALG